jgi:hypothetical protein
MADRWNAQVARTGLVVPALGLSSGGGRACNDDGRAADYDEMRIHGGPFSRRVGPRKGLFVDRAGRKTATRGDRVTRGRRILHPPWKRRHVALTMTLCAK